MLSGPKNRSGSFEENNLALPGIDLEPSSSWFVAISTGKSRREFGG
jgi:hypothetical protein